MGVSEEDEPCHSEEKTYQLKPGSSPTTNRCSLSEREFWQLSSLPHQVLLSSQLPPEEGIVSLMLPSSRMVVRRAVLQASTLPGPEMVPRSSSSRCQLQVSPEAQFWTWELLVLQSWLMEHPSTFSTSIPESMSSGWELPYRVRPPST